MNIVIIYSRTQFKPFAEALVELCARNIAKVGFFNDDDLQTIIEVEDVGRAFRVRWQNGYIAISKAANRYLQRLAARSSVVCFTE